MSVSAANIEHLGQTGLRIDIDQLTILVDPYLSHSVQKLDSPDLQRQFPILYQPKSLTSIDWVFITHDHIDHCDPDTIPEIAKASPKAKFVGPLPVRLQLQQWGIENERIFSSSSSPITLGHGLTAKSVLAAHPKLRLGSDNEPVAVGYLFNRNSHSIYLAGDTSLCEELILSLQSENQINTAFLPINEDNFFRRRRGIIGNMSIREAFGLAEEIGVKNVVPVHWDMFLANGSSMDEIKAVYKSRKWPFKLIKPSEAQL